MVLSDKELQRAYDALTALENCRLYAARHRKEEWAKVILRFCESVVPSSPLREGPSEDL